MCTRLSRTDSICALITFAVNGALCLVRLRSDFSGFMPFSETCFFRLVWISERSHCLREGLSPHILTEKTVDRKHNFMTHVVQKCLNKGSVGPQA